MPTEHTGFDAQRIQGEEPRLWSPATGGTARSSRVPTRRSRELVESIPRSAPAPDSPLRTIPPLIHDHHVAEFLEVLRAGSRDDVVRTVEMHLDRGISMERVSLDLLGPVARRLGELWEEDLCDYFEVTLQMGRIQQAVRLLGPRFAGSGTALAHRPEGRVYLAAPGGEQHTLGLLLVGEFFVRAGWHVTMGGPLDTTRTAHEVRSGRFDLVGVTVSRQEVLPVVAEVLAAVRAATSDDPVPILLGGSLGAEGASAVTTTEADGWASDGLEALEMARDLCGRAAVGIGN